MTCVPVSLWLKTRSLDGLWKFYLLEEEVIFDELVLGILVHALEGIELALKVTLEGVESLDDGVHDIESLLLGESGSKGEVSEVSADSNSSGDDHCSLILGEGRGGELLSIHVRNVLGVLAVLVVVLNDLVEEKSEGLVGIVRSSVATNTRVGVLAAREDSLSEGETGLVLLVLQSVPNSS